jgi:hypothetical protein
MRLGIAHHLGWAVAVTASPDYEVVDRRRIELIEPGVAAAPIHHEGKPLDDAATAALVEQVRESSRRAAPPSLENERTRSCSVRRRRSGAVGNDQRMALAAAIMAG